MSERQLNPEQSTELLAALLASQSSFEWHTKGFSMQPTLYAGYKVWCNPAKAEDLRVGQVVVFRLGQQLILHRIRQMRPSEAGIQVRCKGDNMPNFDPWIGAKDVLAIAYAAQSPNEKTKALWPIKALALQIAFFELRVLLRRIWRKLLH